MKRFLVIFLVLVMPMQMAVSAMCGYCHLAGSAGQEATQAVAHTHMQLAAADSLDADSQQEPAQGHGTACDLCEVASSYGEAPRHQAMIAVAPPAGGYTPLSVPFSDADRPPPEFVPI